VRPRIAAVLPLALVACQKNPVTPAGAEVLRWDTSQSTRPSVVGAREAGPRVAKATKLVVKPDHKGPTTLAITLETAPIEIREGGTTTVHAAPVALRVTTERVTDWTVTGRCDHGPDYPMPSTAPAAATPPSVTGPAPMALSCDVAMHYQDTFNDLTFVVHLGPAGDGALGAAFTQGTLRVEE
jgi:hypothetical protein